MTLLHVPNRSWRLRARRPNGSTTTTWELNTCCFGLIKLGQGVAVNVLQRMGLDLERVRMEVEKHVGSHPETNMIGSIPYTPRVKKVLALAAKEAKGLNHSYVGTEHILLGPLREGEGVAARVLKSLEIDPARTRNEIFKELDPNFTPPEGEAES